MLSPQPTYRSFLAVAKEATRGTAVTATDAIAVRTVTPQDIVMPLWDKGLRGSMAETYGHVPGPTYSTFDFGGDVFADTIGYPLSALLGNVATTGGGASPFTHTFALLNSGDGQPTSMTLTDFDVTNARQYAAWLCSEVAFKFNGDGLLEYTAKGMSLASQTCATTSATFSAVNPAFGWGIATTVGSSTVSTLIDGEVNIKRPVSALHTADGTQAPYKIFGGALSVDGKLKFIMEDDSRLSDFLLATQQILDLNFSTGSGATATQVKLHMTKALFEVATIDRGGDYVAIDCTFQAIANSTDTGTSSGYSPIKVTTQCSKTGGTYA
jgi:hypothetical protein